FGLDLAETFNTSMKYLPQELVRKISCSPLMYILSLYGNSFFLVKSFGYFFILQEFFQGLVMEILIFF
ncbi:MAG TPA: hypothetical protein DD791_11925, partial [Syntrophomonas sp.]|nr:hypothetical protein [Syntrophomonas sp.]